MPALCRLFPYSERSAMPLPSEAPASPDATTPPRRSLKGLWADLGTTITAEDIDEARREMWGNFPREDI